MTKISMMSAVTCIVAPFSVPIGPIPVSLTNLVLFLVLYLLGWKHGTVCCLIYLLMGALGLPVYSGFSGGIGSLLGPTGGYLLGFLPMSLVAGFFIEHFQKRIFHLLGMFLGCMACYLLGTLWFFVTARVDMQQALSLCVLPFIPFDCLKILFAAFTGPFLFKRLQKATIKY